MANNQKTTKAPEMLEAGTRAELVQIIGDYVTGNPGTKVGVVQFDGNREKPFWVNITPKS